MTRSIARMVLIVVFGSICLAILGSLACFGTRSVQSQQSATASPQSSLEIIVEVLDINSLEQTISVNLTIFIHLPQYYNRSSIGVGLMGYLAGIEIECYPDSRFPPMTYLGQARYVTWGIFGYGEFFPFDSYNATFSLWHVDIATDLRDSLSYSVNAHFTGPKMAVLSESWQILNPEENDLPYFVAANSKLVVGLARRSDAYVYWVLSPIVLAGLVLGASAYLDARNRIGDRLLIYTSIFLFGFTFYAVIRDTLPYRTSFTVPEFLIMNMSVEALLLCTMTIVAPSFQFHHHGQLAEGLYRSDLYAILASALFFLVGFVWFFLPIMHGGQLAVTLTLWAYQIVTLLVFACVYWWKAQRLVRSINQDET